MKRIAIFEILDRYGNDDYDHERVIEKITDFADVEEDVYERLVKAQYEYGYKIAVIPTDIKKFVNDTVQNYDAMITQKAEEQRKAKEIAEEKRRKNAAKNKALEEEREKLKLQELLRKHGIPKV